MNEMKIGFRIIQNFVMSLGEAFGDDTFIRNKASCCNYFAPKVKRKICEEEHSISSSIDILGISLSSNLISFTEQ